MYYEGIYEYCGIQRCGKSTLMIGDLRHKLLNYYKPSDVYANFSIFIPGVHCLSNENLLDTIIELKKSKVRNKVIMFDECGQSLTARGYKDKLQTEIVSFAWQMPKRRIVLMYVSNIGNSADVILRLATWVTIMPRYYSGTTRLDDYIRYGVIWNYDARLMRNIVRTHVCYDQNYFDTTEPIE